MFFQFVLSIALFGFASSSLIVGFECEAYADNEFALFDDLLSFEDANAKCKDEGFDSLARIGTDEAFDILQDLIGASQPWVGIHDPTETDASEGTARMVFVDGNTDELGFIHGDRGVEPWRENGNHPANDGVTCVRFRVGLETRDCTELHTFVCRKKCRFIDPVLFASLTGVISLLLVATIVYFVIEVRTYRDLRYECGHDMKIDKPKKKIVSKSEYNKGVYDPREVDTIMSY